MTPDDAAFWRQRRGPNGRATGAVALDILMGGLRLRSSAGRPMTSADVTVMDRAADLALLCGHAEAVSALYAAAAGTCACRHVFAADYAVLKQTHLP